MEKDDAALFFLLKMYKGTAPPRLSLPLPAAASALALWGVGRV